jgi:predicted homoserine dehydrogenase-like protein
VGPLLARLARTAGVIYTIGAGDEPGAIKELYDFATSLAFKVVAAGKGKNNPLDREATPESLKKIALSRDMNPKMLTEFVDGSKTMIEMAALANATGLVPDIRGMHGPQCSIKELSSVFALRDKGGILSQDGVIDYALGDIAPGVFVVISTDNPHLKKDLDYLMMGSGPNYLLYRPYHLANIEVPISIARAILYREPTLKAEESLIAEVITMAKKNLRVGEELDGIGGYTVYGSIEKAGIAKKEKLLPLGLVQGAIMRDNISQGEYITYGNVELDSSSFLLNLRKIQDEFFLRG